MIADEQAFRIGKQDFHTALAMYEKNLAGFVVATGVRDYQVNDDAFASAMDDIQADLNIICWRRLRRVDVQGISNGKVAGIYAFRLVRAPIVNFCGQRAAHPHDRSVNTIIGLKTALDVTGLTLTRLHSEFIRELSFNLRKRHVNQETLALVIDSVFDWHGRR